MLRDELFPQLTDSDVKTIYKKVRNALYYIGITSLGVILTGNVSYVLQVKDTRLEMDVPDIM